MLHTTNRPLTIGALKALLDTLPDDGIVVLDCRSEERVLMEGELRVENTAGTTDDGFNNNDENRDATEDGFRPVFPAVLHLTSWS
jgi:hypothetical protein